MQIKNEKYTNNNEYVVQNDVGRWENIRLIARAM